MGITRIPTVIRCSHADKAEVVWLDLDVPHIEFRGIPIRGEMILSKVTIVVVCDRCRDVADQIRRDHHLRLDRPD